MTPAVYIRQLLIDEGVGTEEGDWKVYVSFLPPSPDLAICVYDTTPKDDGRVMDTGERISHPGIQVVVRGDYPYVFLKVQEICDLFDSLLDKEVTFGGETKKIHSMTRTSGVIPLGVEEKGHKSRHLMSVNYIATFSTL